MSLAGSEMVGDWNGATTPMEWMEYASKACTDRMRMLDGEALDSPPKKLKVSGNYGSMNEAGGVAQSNCALTNTIGSTSGSVSEASRVAGIAKMDEKGLKDE